VYVHELVPRRVRFRPARLNDPDMVSGVLIAQPHCVLRGARLK
jgi:hypothetical protein